MLLMSVILILLSEEAAGVSKIQPTSIENACPGKRVSVVCVITMDNTMIWIVPDPTRVMGSLQDVSFSRFLHDSIVGQTRSIPGDTMGAYQLTLNSLTPNLTSTLEVTLYSSMDGRDIQCSGITVPIHLHGLPNTPSNFHIIATLNNSLNSTVTFDWEYSTLTNQVVAAVNFSLHVYDSESIVTLTTSRNQADLHLSYNTNYTAVVESVNCAGSSSSSLISFTLVKCNKSAAASSIQNGVLTFSSFTEDGTATLSCDKGFIPNGANVSKCTSHTTWEPVLQSLSCTAVVSGLGCSPLYPPHNGHLFEYSNSSSPIGTVIRYQCDDGLFPKDTKITECRSDGTWSSIPMELKCRENPVNCTLPGEPINGMIIGYEFHNTSLVEGSVIRFQCDPGFLPSGEMNVTCNNSGVWSDNPSNFVCRSTATHGCQDEVCIIAVIAGSVFIVIGSATLIAIIMAARLVKRQRCKVPRQTVIPSPSSEEEYSELRRVYAKGSQIPTTNNTETNYNVLCTLSTMREDPESGQVAQSSYAEISLDTSTVLSHEPVVNSHAVAYSLVDIETTQAKAKEIPVLSNEDTCTSGYDQSNEADMLLDLDHTLVQLKSVQNKWKEIGAALHVPVTHIEQVESYCTGNDVIGMTEVLDFWIRRPSTQPTWKELADALKSVDEEKLVQELSDVYTTGHLPLDVNFKEVPDIYRHDSPPPPIPARTLDSCEDVTMPSSLRSVKQVCPPPLPPKPHFLQKEL